MDVTQQNGAAQVFCVSHGSSNVLFRVGFAAYVATFSRSTFSIGWHVKHILLYPAAQGTRHRASRPCACKNSPSSRGFLSSQGLLTHRRFILFFAQRLSPPPKTAYNYKTGYVRPLTAAHDNGEGTHHPQSSSSNASVKATPGPVPTPRTKLPLACVSRPPSPPPPPPVSGSVLRAPPARKSNAGLRGVKIVRKKDKAKVEGIGEGSS